MTCGPSTFNKLSTNVQWMWNSSANPFSESESDNWCPYSDVENMIIEEAFIANESLVEFDEYDIDLKHKVQISKIDGNNQRPIKRMDSGKDDKHFRKERFLSNPVSPNRPFSDPDGFISPFIKQVVKHLNLTKEQLPSKNEAIVPEIVEKAAQGIVEEGEKLRKRREAEYIANLLREKKEAGIKEIWKYCAHLYSCNSFLHKNLNETMRLIGSEDHEDVWQSKISTLGPFCLLLWDNPLNSKMIKPGTIFYRGTQLSDDLIRSFEGDCFKDSKPWRSFQAFTSCTRNRSVAEMYGNVMFIMESRIAFTADIQQFSKFPDEEEELLFPGVSFTINRMEFDKKNNKTLIYIILQQRRHSKSG